MLLCCTQAKLFITKGMVFNITFTVTLMCAWGCFCQSLGVFFSFFVAKTLVKFSWLIQRDRERAYVLPCAPPRGMVKCQGFKAATLENGVNTKPSVRWIGSLSWSATASLLALIVKVLV